MNPTPRAFVTNAEDGTVSTFSVAPDGGLVRLAVSPVGKGCGTLVVDAARQQVHVGIKGEPAAIVTMAIEADGALREVGRREVPDAVHYLVLTPDGSTLLAASYGGGFGASMPVTAAGVGEIASRVEHPNVHSCAVSADGRTAYFVSLGADLIAQCALREGRLEPLGSPTVAAPEGSGPRHIVLNRANDAAYVMTEFSGEVLHYERAESGELTLRGVHPAYDPDAGLSHSRMGADPAAEHLIWGADIHLAADESVLWASERCASTLATLPLGADGVPGEVRQFVPTPKQPRGFGVSPDGGVVLCTGEKASEVESYVVSPTDGTLASVARAETGRGANWVRFLG